MQDNCVDMQLDAVKSNTLCSVLNKHCSGTYVYGHLGTNKKCPDCQGILIFQVSL